MEYVKRLELRIVEKKAVVLEYAIFKHIDKEYETAAMLKGFQMVNGAKINRRVYKNELGLLISNKDMSKVIELEDMLISYAYSFDLGIEDTKNMMIQGFKEYILSLKNKATMFINEYDSLCSVK